MSWQAQTNSHWENVELFKLNPMWCLFPNLKCPPLPEGAAWLQLNASTHADQSGVFIVLWSNRRHCPLSRSATSDVLFCRVSGLGTKWILAPAWSHCVPDMFTIITPNAQLVSTCSSSSSVKSQTDLANRKWSNSLLRKAIGAVKTQLQYNIINIIITIDW